MGTRSRNEADLTVAAWSVEPGMEESAPHFAGRSHSLQALTGGLALCAGPRWSKILAPLLDPRADWTASSSQVAHHIGLGYVD